MSRPPYFTRSISSKEVRSRTPAALHMLAHCTGRTSAADTHAASENHPGLYTARVGNDATEPRLSYESRLNSASIGYERVDARWNLVANARLVAFLAAAVAAAWGLWGRAAAGWVLAGPPFGGF